MTTKRKKTDTSASKMTNFRLPADLLEWVKAFAKEKNTTVTRLIVDHFTELRARNEEGHVDQI